MSAATPAPRGRPTIDLSGTRFGKLLLQEHLGCQYYRCLCDCGREVTRRAYHMRSGAVAHCGCSPNPPLRRRSTAVTLMFSDEARALIAERAKINHVSDYVYLHRIVMSVLNRFKQESEEKKPVQQASSQSSQQSSSQASRSKSLMFVVALIFFTLSFTLAARGQAKSVAPATPTDPPLTVTPSPTEDALVAAAKELASSQRSFNDLMQQARTALEASQKSLSADLAAAQKDLQQKLEADKHYKPLLDNINAMQQKINAAATQAQQDFNAKSAPLQQTIQRDQTLVQSLVPIVRKEQGLPGSATFDPEKAEWHNLKSEKK